MTIAFSKEHKKAKAISPYQCNFRLFVTRFVVVVVVVAQQVSTLSTTSHQLRAVDGTTLRCKYIFFPTLENAEFIHFFVCANHALWLSLSIYIRVR